MNGAANETAANATARALCLLLTSTPPGSPDMCGKLFLRCLIGVLAHHFLDAGAKVLEHDRCRISPGHSGNRAAGSRAGSGLIEAGNWHLVLRPSWHGAHRARLGRVARAVVRAAAPHRGIHALDIERTLEKFSQEFVRSKIRSKSAQIVEKSFCNFVLNVVPVLRTFFQRVGHRTLELQC